MAVVPVREVPAAGPGVPGAVAGGVAVVDVGDVPDVEVLAPVGDVPLVDVLPGLVVEDAVVAGGGEPLEDPVAPVVVDDAAPGAALEDVGALGAPPGAVDGCAFPPAAITLPGTALLVTRTAAR